MPIQVRRTVTMPATTTLFRVARPAFRPNFFTAQAARSTRTRFGRRRWQSTAAPAEPIQQTLAQRLWNSPVGVKTVHFWYAPPYHSLLQISQRLTMTQGARHEGIQFSLNFLCSLTNSHRHNPIAPFGVKKDTRRSRNKSNY